MIYFDGVKYSNLNDAQFRNNLMCARFNTTEKKNDAKDRHFCQQLMTRRSVCFLVVDVITSVNWLKSFFGVSCLLGKRGAYNLPFLILNLKKLLNFFFSIIENQQVFLIATLKYSIFQEISKNLSHMQLFLQLWKFLAFSPFIGKPSKSKHKQTFTKH